MSLNGRKKNAPCLKRNLQRGSRGYSVEFRSLLKETSVQENKGNNISCGFTRTKRSGSIKKEVYKHEKEVSIRGAYMTSYSSHVPNILPLVRFTGRPAKSRKCFHANKRVGTYTLSKVLI